MPVYNLDACTPHARTASATPEPPPAGTPRATASTPKTPKHTKTQISRSAQTDFFSAAKAKAFTMVLAGFAFTITILPKISLLPALVAGFRRVLIMHRPGIVHLPVFF